MELTTERLILRDFTADDRAALIAYQSDPRYVEFYGPEERGHEHTLKLLDMFLQWRVEQPRRNFQLAIVERNAPPDPIGCCGVRSKGFESGVAEFGLELAPRCWGRGLATEAARALLTFAFRDLGLHIIFGVSVTQNYRVARLINRLGFRSVSTRVGPNWMRARGWSQTEWRLTAEEWEEASLRYKMLIKLAKTDSEITACYPVMRELRSHISEESFVSRVRDQEKSGYRLAYVQENNRSVALAGFRIGENLAWGRFLYVDDLVTLPSYRSRGYGAALLSWIEDLAQTEGCAQVHLDSRMQRKDAHRFYERAGMEIVSFHFRKVIMLTRGDDKGDR